MVGGDRRSPPRHRAKGGGGSGKGKLGGGGVGADGGGSGKEKSGVSDGKVLDFEGKEVRDCSALSGGASVPAKGKIQEILEASVFDKASILAIQEALDKSPFGGRLGASKEVTNSGPKVRDLAAAVEAFDPELAGASIPSDEVRQYVRSSLKNRGKPAPVSSAQGTAHKVDANSMVPPGKPPLNLEAGMECDHDTGTGLLNCIGGNFNFSYTGEGPKVDNPSSGRAMCVDGESDNPNYTDMELPHACTSGVCDMANTGFDPRFSQAEKANLDFDGNTMPTENFWMDDDQSRIPFTEKLNEQTATEPTRDTKQRPNAWHRPQHIRINKEELGTISVDGTTVALDETAFNTNLGKLRRALVGKIIGKILPLNILDLELHRRWGSFGDFYTVLIEADCFICIFESMEARDAVLLGGPWQVAGHIIGLDKWTPTFAADSMNGLSSPVWIRLPSLPLLYWDNKTIGRIAAMIGEPLWIDAQTGEWGRSTYARICVRLDLSKKLPAGVWIQGKTERFFQKIEFEGISILCFNCGIVGHKDTVCPQKAQPNESRGKEHNSCPDGTKAHNASKQANFGATIGQRAFGPGSGANKGWEHGESSSNAAARPSETNPGDLTTAPVESLTSPDEQLYGPWTLVTRRRKNSNKHPNPHGKNSGSGKLNIGNRAPRGPLPQHPDSTVRMTNSTLPPTPVFGTQDFSAKEPRSKDVMLLTSSSLSKKSKSVSRPRTGKERVSKSHFDKELQELGPIEAKPRKTKKSSSGVDIEDVIQTTTAQVGSLQIIPISGGDTSPLVE